jgi:putative ABC transport system substrate-binding protein
MRRREVVGLLTGAAVWPTAASAQQAAQPLIGFISATSAQAYPHLIAAFHRGLAETGYSEGRNVTIAYRWAEGDYGRLPALAAELVRQGPAVITATGGTVSGEVAKAATSTIPIVMLSGADPVRRGLIDSFSRPGGNVTGVAQLTTSLVAKRVELLRELVPQATAIALLVNPNRPTAEMQAEVEAAAHTFGQTVHVIKASREAELEPAFAELGASGAGALMVIPDSFLFFSRKQIVALAARHAVPAIYDWREFVDDGGLVSYGTSLTEAYHQVGVYTGKILGGAKPADLPMVQQSTKLELVLNSRTARALALAIPPTLIARADEVIE